MPEVAKHASWLYWVAALSLVNLVLILTKTEFGFAISLGLTDFLTAMGTEAGSGFQTVAISFSLVVIAFMAVLGYFACRAAIWALSIGVAVLVLDTGLLLLAGTSAIVSIAIHVWAIVSLVMGIRAAMELRNAEPAQLEDWRQPPPPHA